MSYFIAFCSKKRLFVPDLALIALGDSHHSQGGMKFATQISPLLNLLLNKTSFETVHDMNDARSKEKYFISCIFL
jgi:hypothetical protein